MTGFVELLARGYLPRELPPPFTSRTFAQFGANDPILANQFNGKQRAVLPSTYHLARQGTIRRVLSIPNPRAMFQVADLIARRRMMLIQRSRSPMSLSDIQPSSWGRSLIPRTHFRELPHLRARYRQGRRILVKADISRFYDSIYTHSIPWAIHTKKWAKNNRSKPCIGNALDAAVRRGQSDQTIGIPIGPDTSLMLAEVIAAAIDRRMLPTLPTTVRAMRHVDDYEFACAGNADAEEALTALETILADFGLALNPAKLVIQDIPSTLDFPWAVALRRRRFRTTRAGQLRDITDHFDEASAMAVAYPTDSVMNYAVSMLRSMLIDRRNWPTAQTLLLNALTAEAGTAQFVLEQLVKYRSIGYPIDRAALQECLRFMILRFGPRAHHSEVAWAVWISIVFGLSIDSAAVAVLDASDNAVVALLGLDAMQRGLLTSAPTANLWSQAVTPDGLIGSQWLLSYEAKIKGWLGSSGMPDHLAAVDYFSRMRALGIYFYDSAAALAFDPAGTRYRPSPFYGS